MDKTVIFNKEVLELFVTNILIKLNVSEEDAKTVSKSLILADLRGTYSHGVLRLLNYVEAIEKGGINPRAKMEVIINKEGALLIDGCHGLGQVCGTYAMKAAVETAAEKNIVAVGVRNSSHFGIGAYYAMLASEKNMVGIAMTNTRALMPPSGGKQAMLGNNPIAIAIPACNYPDIILDMACSVAAFGKIRFAAASGQHIPADWALDIDGKPTTDPNKAIESGLILPMASHKGYGLALIVDLLTGLLTKSAYGPSIRSIFLDPEHPECIGHFFIAININAFYSVDAFKQSVDEYISAIKTSPTREGVKEIFLPGEIEHKNFISTSETGIPIEQQIVKQLQDLGVKYGVALDVN